MKIFIPAAGLGSRIQNDESLLPKPLKSIGSLPLISVVMNLYPEGTSFVIGLGFRASWVEQIVRITAKTNRQEVQFYVTDSWSKDQMGLTHTVIKAKDLLQEPFIFHAVDTLIPEQIVKELLGRAKDTIVTGKPSNPGNYRFVQNKRWGTFPHSGESNQSVYIGVSLIQGFADFWHRMDTVKMNDKEAGETLGIDLDNCHVMELEPHVWIDCGNPVGLLEARRLSLNPDVVLERKDEAIWHIGSEMVKFHVDEIFIENRVKRAEALNPYVPAVTKRGENTYSYQRENGCTLSSGKSEDFKKFLYFLTDFWELESTLNKAENTVGVRSEFLDFYQHKTKSRVQTFLGKYPTYSVQTINSSNVRSIYELLENVDWSELATPILCRAHGDLHPDNVLILEESPGFMLLDWRQDIAGNLGKLGDIYYDLAKIKHGLKVDHSTILRGQFEVTIAGIGAEFGINQSEKKMQWEDELNHFIEDSSLDLARVDLITALIFLNIAALHHVPYDSFLFVFGHKLLENCIPTT